MDVTYFPYRQGDEIGGVVVISRDITDQRLLEQQLQQAQKLEAVGRLAGGVAHDFNNLLTGITGNIALALMRMNELDPLRDRLKEIDSAARRAANVTRQLLAFSRKQVIDLQVVSPLTLLRNLGSLLERLLGEDIRITWELDSRHRAGQSRCRPDRTGPHQLGSECS